MKLLLTTIGKDNPNTDLALRYLYSVVSDAPLDVAMHSFDMIQTDSDIYGSIVRGRYNIVYFHCVEENEARITEIARMIKMVMPSIAIVAGGEQVSYDTEKYMLENPYVDYALIGEGEKPMFHFIKSLVLYKFDFEEIAGFAYRNSNQIIVNEPEEPVDMDEIPFPYEKTNLTSDIVFYESIRGSQDRTTFNKHIGTEVRSLSLNRICTELRYFLVKKVSKVVFLDRWFNYNTEKSYRIFEYIINNDNGETCFEFDINGDNIDEETVRLLSEAREGLFIFNIDVVSTNAETLAAIGRKENIYQLMYNVTKLIQASKVKLYISIVAGLPYDTETLFARSFNKAYGLAEGSPLSIRVLTLPKGSQLRNEAEKYGYIYLNNSPYTVIASDYMPATDMINVKMIANIVDKYIGEGGFRDSIPRILNDTGVKPYELFDKLANYIYNKGWENKLNKKENLYRILYDFADNFYDEDSDPLKLDILQRILHSELESMISEEEIKCFERKGWSIEF
ncbi:MAG TPA: DUF4080 domain-containing protein [Mogibacterium sp.]|nr:DUF4080 domain-containing protein [Mogibacterium sp.]